MATIKPIRSEEDYEAALERIDALMGAQPGTTASNELDVLVDLVEHYEEKHVPLDWPTPVEAIAFRMEQQGLAPRDLVPLLGTRARVSEVLSGKRSLSVDMMRALHEHLGIPAASLLRGPAKAEATGTALLRELVKRGWIKGGRGKAGLARAESSLSDLAERAGAATGTTPRYRKNDHARKNAKADAAALDAWCWMVLATAREARRTTAYRRGTVTPTLLREVARLSARASGPRDAVALLAGRGIPVVVVPHLPRTYLDGAALKRADGAPVIGLTLRHDRIDNFWFCLLHELAHVGRHLDAGRDEGFFDDLDMPAGDDAAEREADEWATEALIPAALWRDSEARLHPGAGSVIALAQEAGIHPALVAGRVRHERRNFRLLTQFVGGGEVRKQFPDWAARLGGRLQK